MKGQSFQVKQLRKSNSSNSPIKISGNPQQLVEKALQTWRLKPALQKMQSQGPEAVRLTLKDANADRFMRCLHEIENKYALGIENLSIVADKETGLADSSFNIKGNQLTADGIVAVTPSKKVILDDTSFDIDAAFFNSYQKQAKLNGDLQGKIDHAEIEQNIVPIIDAIIDWKQGTVSSLLLNLAAGDYHFVVAPDSEGLLIKPSSKEAPLDLKGNVKLSKDWLLKPDIMVNSRDEGIASMLKLAGKPQSDGSTHITTSTNLKPFLNLK
ncbi:hypothetical protein GQR58_003355 [Nymphon striatum]|nr:hypothetical protein GQR58_003355 [Nymphon striatum]